MFLLKPGKCFCQAIGISYVFLIITIQHYNQTKMNPIKMLLMATFTFVSLSAIAQQKTTEKNNPQQKTSYYCPMKCEGDKTYTKAGKCPKCKMNLIEKKATAAKAYYCPMKCEGDKTYAEAGKCPKCKMNLVEKKEENSNHKH